MCISLSVLNLELEVAGVKLVHTDVAILTTAHISTKIKTSFGVFRGSYEPAAVWLVSERVDRTEVPLDAAQLLPQNLAVVG